MIINYDELKKFDEKTTYNEGYRIVYFDDNNYYLGPYCKSIEGFMIGFADCDPILFEDDIPQFISVDDLLARFLDQIKDIFKVALYNVDGSCIAIKERKIKEKNI